MAGEVEALENVLRELRAVKRGNKPSAAHSGRENQGSRRGIEIAEAVIRRHIASARRSCGGCGGSGLAPDGETACSTCDGSGRR